MTTTFAAEPASPTQSPRFPKGEGYGVQIGGVWYRLAPNAQQPVRYYTKDSLAPRQDRTGSVYENVLDIGHVFARGDLSGGEGLDWYPRFISQQADTEERDLIRFWDTNNIDIRRPVRGELSRVTLSRPMAQWATLTGGADLASSDKFIYVAYGSTVEWWNDWDAGSPTGSAATAAPVDQIEVSPAGDVMALLDDGTLTHLTEGTSTFVAVPTLTNVLQTWFAKGRFIAEVDNLDGSVSLQEYDSAGPIGVPFDVVRGFVYSMVSSGPAVVAAMSDGTLRSYVPEQSNQIDPSSVSLVIRGISEMPEGEVPYLLGSNADILLILTQTTGDTADNDIRLYQAEVLDARFDYVIGSRQLRREWENTSVTINKKKNMANTRDEIWFLIHETATEQMAWRFDLVTFGLSRHVTTAVTGAATSLVVYDDRAGFLATDIVYVSSNTVFMPEGYIISPNITFGLNTAINFIAMVIASTDLTASGKQVELWYSTDPKAILDVDDPSWRLGIRASNPSQSEEEAFLNEVTSKQVALKLVLFSSEANTNAPNVNNWAIRGIQAQRDMILELPIDVSDWVSVPGRRPVHIPTYGDVIHRQVMSLVGKSVETVVLDPPMLWRGVVDQVLQPTEYITDRGGVGIRSILQLRGARLTATTNPTGDAGLGIGILGIDVLGVGQTAQT